LRNTRRTPSIGFKTSQNLENNEKLLTLRILELADLLQNNTGIHIHTFTLSETIKHLFISPPLKSANIVRDITTLVFTKVKLVKRETNPSSSAEVKIREGLLTCPCTTSRCDAQTEG
jgi:hypothetical protein